MGLRGILVALIVLATVGFVIGTSVERHQSQHESAATLKSEGRAPAAHVEGRETPAAHAAEGGPSGRATDRHPELKPLGVNVEAVPFVVLAAVASLLLAILAWARPRWLVGLLAVAATMLVFSVLDVREVVHQSDEGRTGLAALAALIAALHGAAAATAIVMGDERARGGQLATSQHPPPAVSSTLQLPPDTSQGAKFAP